MVESGAAISHWEEIRHESTLGYCSHSAHRSRNGAGRQSCAGGKDRTDGRRKSTGLQTQGSDWHREDADRTAKEWECGLGVLPVSELVTLLSKATGPVAKSLDNDRSRRSEGSRH